MSYVGIGLRNSVAIGVGGVVSVGGVSVQYEPLETESNDIIQEENDDPLFLEQS